MTTADPPREARLLEVVRAGPLTTVQDDGRPGYAHLGVPRAGALDQPARALANRVVGNGPGAAVLETTVGGVALRAGADCVVAVTGARSEITVDGRPAAWGLPAPVRRGEVIDIGAAAVGVRSYVAVDGGFAVARVLGSRSTDTLGGLGPPPLRDGVRVPLGPSTLPAVALDFAAWPEPADPVILRLHLGPRDDWLADAGLAALRSGVFTATTLSNRVALRLDGPLVARRTTDELPSEGIVLGALQLPADGRPLVFLADHPTTGGYPVVGVVDHDDLAACAQVRPGAVVRFRVLPRRPGYGSRA